MRKISNQQMKELKKLIYSSRRNLDFLAQDLGVLENAADDYYNERSDKWCESPAGENYSLWIEELRETICIIECMVEDLDGIDLDELQMPIN